jgi:pimeloyl-ACP methyl ester carboxylesterase
VTVPQRPAGENASIDVVLNGAVLSEIMIDAIAQDPGSIGSILFAMTERSTPDLEGLADYMITKYSNGSGMSEGVFYSMLCNEEHVFALPDEVNRDGTAYWQWFGSPELADVPEANIDFCNHWPAGSPSPIENEAVVSDIPALLLVGEFDPLTPPDLAKSTRHNLRNSFGFEFMNAGHGLAISHFCARNAISAFLDRPGERPNAICLGGTIAREF